MNKYLYPSHIQNTAIPVADESSKKKLLQTTWGLPVTGISILINTTNIYTNILLSYNEASMRQTMKDLHQVMIGLVWNDNNINTITILEIVSYDNALQLG